VANLSCNEATRATPQFADVTLPSRNMQASTEYINTAHSMSAFVKTLAFVSL